jgi:hypothetical protein
MSRQTLPFECIACNRRYNPAIFPDSCQCDSGHCECGAELEQVDPRETVRWCFLWMLTGALVWSVLIGSAMLIGATQ